MKRVRWRAQRLHSRECSFSLCPGACRQRRACQQTLKSMLLMLSMSSSTPHPISCFRCAPSSARVRWLPQACCSDCNFFLRHAAHAVYMSSRLALCWNGYQGGVLLTHAGKNLQAFPALRNLQEKVKGLALSSLCAWQSESYGVQYCLPLHSSATT